MFRNIFFLWRVVSSVQPLDRGPPVVGCPLQLIEYIRGYPLYLKIIVASCIVAITLTKYSFVFHTLLPNFALKCGLS
jgi:hypothetical protein